MGSESTNPRFQHIFKEFSYNQEKYDELYATGWKPVCELFRIREGGITIGQLLHNTVYVATILGVWHYWWQVKLDVSDPLVYAALLAILLAYRAWRRWVNTPSSANVARSPN